MARFVEMVRSGGGSAFWVNADRVVVVGPGTMAGKARITIDDGSESGDYEYVIGAPSEIAALLNGEPPAPVAGGAS